MKTMKWSIVLMLVLLAACTKTAADNGPAAEPQAPQNVAQNIGQNAGQNVSQIATPNPAQNVTTPAAAANTSTPKPPPPPVKSLLSILGLVVAPAVVDVGHPAVIIVTVNNTDTKFATYPVALMIDGIQYATQTVSLPGGAGANVTFDFTPMNERNVFISCGDITKELTIQHS